MKAPLETMARVFSAVGFTPEPVAHSPSPALPGLTLARLPEGAGADAGCPQHDRVGPWAQEVSQRPPCGRCPRRILEVCSHDPFTQSHSARPAG